MAKILEKYISKAPLKVGRGSKQGEATHGRDPPDRDPPTTAPMVAYTWQTISQEEMAS